MDALHAFSTRVLILACLTFAGFTISSVSHAACTGENVCFGTNALQSVTTGTNNVALGKDALGNTTTGNNNTAIGEAALKSNVSNSGNIAIGRNALNDVVFENPATGIGSIAIGDFALARRNHGADNIAIGRNAMFDNSENSVSGSDNIAIGAGSLLRLSLGVENTAIGVNALNGAKSTSRGLTASYNVAVGGMALYGLRNGDNNTAVGYNALAEIFSGFRNTAMGTDALTNTTTGFRNVAVGNGAGLNVTTGSDNIILGTQNHGLAAEVGAIRIGSSAFQKKAFIAGVSGVKTGLATAKTVFIDANGQLGTIKSSARYKEDIESMGSVSERLMSLRPVTFRYKEHEGDGTKPIQFGLIAEEVAEAFPELVIYDEDGKPETVRYELIVTMLLNEFQKERDANQAELAKLKNDVARMAEIIQRLDHENENMVASTQ
jgi:trimeric autotransporter adhesin